MRFRKSHDVAVDEENPYWMSFSDIMSALLVISAELRPELCRYRRAEKGGASAPHHPR